MIRRFISPIVTCVALLLLASAASAQYTDCHPLWYYNKTGTNLAFVTALPSKWFAVKFTPNSAGRIDTLLIGLGFNKDASTKLRADTVIVKVLENNLPTWIELDSYVFAIPPGFNGQIADMDWQLELFFFGRDGSLIDPARDVWVAWKLSGPPVDMGRILMKQAKTTNPRSVVINGNHTTTPVSTFMWQQLQDTVDFRLEARICYPPVPVELSSFNGSIVDGKAFLRWSTATETENFGFYIERLQSGSENGMIAAWNKLGFVPGNGSTNEDQYYSYIDETPSSAADINGVVKYRLRQVDYDGSENLSPVLSLILPENNSASMLGQTYPNPVSISAGTVLFPFTSRNGGRARLVLHDALGRQIAVIIDDDLQAGSHTVSFIPSQLTPGWYFYTLQCDGATATKRFLAVQ